MAGRPIKKRTAESYESEVHMLSRLQTAIKLDRALPREEQAEAVRNIDNLLESLMKLIDITRAA